MVKNKIYNYFLKEILKSFFTILFAFTIIAWTVRSVNFLDLIVDDGHSLKLYISYTFLNITNIITKFIPLSFLLALTISILRLERQNELIILWTSGIKKIKLVNIFFILSIFILFFQLIFSVFITPYSLNKSRNLVKDSGINSASLIIKKNDFSDTLKNITFYVEKLNERNELENIFIRDNASLFSGLVPTNKDLSNTSVFAKKGFIKEKKIVLFDGLIQSQDNKGAVEYINFSRTEFSLSNLNTRTIKVPKMQEMSTLNLLECQFDKKIIPKIPSQLLSTFELERLDDLEIRNCPKKGVKTEVLRTLARRIGTPLFIPVVCLISCFMLVANKKKENLFKKYLIFFQGFMILVLSEVLGRYSGNSNLNTIIYFLTPITLSVIIYLLLLTKLNYEKRI